MSYLYQINYIEIMLHKFWLWDWSSNNI